MHVRLLSGSKINAFVVTNSYVVGNNYIAIPLVVDSIEVSTQVKV